MRLGSVLRDASHFRLERQVKIYDPQLAGLNRVLQAGAVVSIVVAMYVADQWAYSEVPMGMVNAWPDMGDWASQANIADYATALSYCSGADKFSYSYSPNFVMDNPECVRMHPYEISSKENKRVAVTTAFTEIREVGWPAVDGSSADVANRALCTARGGTISDLGAHKQQRQCVSTRTVYPVGADAMHMALEHAYVPAASDSPFHQMRGSSNVKSGESGAVPTLILDADGEVVRRVPSGAGISDTIQGWLAVAGVTLDEPNTNLTADYRDATKFPPFRSAGVSIDILIAYDNRDLVTKKPACAC